ncbi:hypothetical protein Dacet_1627 [Denitrovibrio acetiphilus DSM 12809]|uniref:DUF4136 domain-containing protein n=1 Tax=Denitrovibrio acetiphilus (strain DSM 12809 / NBRC 114555 / N2460) TaxID=522772 RepID=D4H8P4_DENA2|nr:hypothetical protein [Denitrovibrio acetiphilus]ADD68393.1 hypothetical protein Dacet_1627 [Denitrovibrio acetiphilus DSM 12809]
MKKIVFYSFMLMFIFGCATTYKGSVTGYGGQGTYGDMTYDFIITDNIRTDLEAMGYVASMENQLKCINWIRNSKSSEYVIALAFGVTGAEKSDEPKARVGGGIGFFGGSMGSGISLGTFLGSSSGSSGGKEYVKFLDVKLFEKDRTDSTPLWQGKIVSTDENMTLAEVMPVLIKYAVENFGRSTDGSREFTFDATDEEIRALEECSTD